MPRLWNDTIETHRAAVRDAILDSAAALVDEHGVQAVTMSQLAERSSIGRATLYKYFPDLQSVLLAWHERQVTDHVEQLRSVRDRTRGAARQLEAVLQAFAHLSRVRHGSDLTALLHQGPGVQRAHAELHALLRDLLAGGARDGDLRSDVAPDVLASFCLHALGAASELPSEAAVRGLVAVTLAGLRPPA